MAPVHLAFLFGRGTVAMAKPPKIGEELQLVERFDVLGGIPRWADAGGVAWRPCQGFSGTRRVAPRRWVFAGGRGRRSGSLGGSGEKVVSPK